MVRAISISRWSTPRIAANRFRYIGTPAPKAISRTFVSSSMPNHTTNSGSTASSGMVLRICASPLNTYSPLRRKPPSTPVTMPTLNPRARPTPGPLHRDHQVGAENPVLPQGHGSADDVGGGRCVRRLQHTHLGENLPHDENHHGRRVDPQRPAQPAAHRAKHGGATDVARQEDVASRRGRVRYDFCDCRRGDHTDMSHAASFVVGVVTVPETSPGTGAIKSVGFFCG